MEVNHCTAWGYASRDLSDFRNHVEKHAFEEVKMEARLNNVKTETKAMHMTINSSPEYDQSSLAMQSINENSMIIDTSGSSDSTNVLESSDDHVSVGRLSPLVESASGGSKGRKRIDTPCILCGRIFPCRNNMLRHLRTHGTKKFHCRYCSKQFHRHDQINQHEIQHMLDIVGVYECPVKECPEQEYSLLRTLKKHMESVHHIRTSSPALCKHCSSKDRKFTTVLGLLGHFQRQHALVESEEKANDSPSPSQLDNGMDLSNPVMKQSQEAASTSLPGFSFGSLQSFDLLLKSFAQLPPEILSEMCKEKEKSAEPAGVESEEKASNSPSPSQLDNGMDLSNPGMNQGPEAAPISPAFPFSSLPAFDLLLNSFAQLPPQILPKMCKEKEKSPEPLNLSMNENRVQYIAADNLTFYQKNWLTSLMTCPTPQPPSNPCPMLVPPTERMPPSIDSSNKFDQVSQPSSSLLDQSQKSCPHCGIWYQDEFLYAQHKSLHSFDDPLKCSLCGLKCSDILGFTAHVITAKH